MATALLPRFDRRPAIAPAREPADILKDICDDAFAYHRDGQLREAIALYRRILVLKDLPLIRNNLGHALWELGQLDAATFEYRRAVELKPDYAQALCNWAGALMGLDRLDEAEEKLRQAIAVNSGFAGAHNNLALILKERGRVDEASRAAKRAIRLAPRNTSFYETLAACRRRRLEAAIGRPNFHSAS